MSKWITHFKQMANGKIPYKERYIVSEVTQSGSGFEPKIELVTPVESEVKKAKSAVKRKISEILSIKNKKRKKLHQSGKGKPSKRSTKKKKTRT